MEIVYNTEFHRWEVYSKNVVIRNGEKQPDFVSDDYQKCITYRAVVTGHA